MTAASRPTTAAPADHPAAPAAPPKPTTPPRHDQRVASKLKTSLSGKLPPAGPGGMTSRRLTADQPRPPEPGKTDQFLYVAGAGTFLGMAKVFKDVSPAEFCSYALCVTCTIMTSVSPAHHPLKLIYSTRCKTAQSQGRNLLNRAIASATCVPSACISASFQLSHLQLALEIWGRSQPPSACGCAEPPDIEWLTAVLNLLSSSVLQFQVARQIC